MDSQLSTEISQLLLKLPDSKLKPILEYLKQVEKMTSEQIEKVTLDYVKLGSFTS